MYRPLLIPLAALLLAFAIAQDDHSDHSEHDAMPNSGQIVFDLGDSRFVLVPLIAKTDSGYHGTMVLAAADGMAMTDSDGESSDHGEHDDGDMGHDDHDADDMEHQEDMEAEHDDHDDHEHGPDLAVALLDPNGAVFTTATLSASDAAPGAYALTWFSDAALDDTAGLWRLTVMQGDHRADLPVSVVVARSDTTELLAVFAPAPSLSSAGLTETYVYAYRALEPVHAAMSVQRQMAGMRHATDEDRVALMHDHFQTLTDLVPAGEAMANRAPLNFAMAGTWDLTITIEDDDSEAFVLAIDVLSE